MPDDKRIIKEEMMANKTPEERIGINETEIDTLKQSDEKQWTAIDDLRQFMRKLVPVWTTIVLMVMSGVTASALTFAGMMLKMSGK